MDWKSLSETLPAFPELAPRATRLSQLERVLDGTHYDELGHPFSREKNAMGEYIPLDQRRPAVKTNLCRVVVEDSVSLLFSEGHWPPLRAKSDKTMDGLTKLVKHTQLNETMLEAATRGAVGSVAVHFKVLDRRPFFDVIPTCFLTPEWDEKNPNVLKSVTELRPVLGRELAEIGYAIAAEDLAQKFWFRKKWDREAETWFVPEKQSSLGSRQALAAHQWIADGERSVIHGLGFCPMVWIRNLPAGNRHDGIDGCCTFEAAIDTVIEADYLMSQGGRALKYASDPTLVIKQGAQADAETAHKGGVANALSVDVDGDAKLLEINGDAAKAVIEHVRALRGISLESIHGNRVNADRLSAAASGRSIELMMGGLIALADRLRITYGEGALLTLLRMVCAASQKIDRGLLVDTDDLAGLDPEGLELRWPAWMPAMPRDVLEGAQALVTGVENGLVSQKTAIAHFGALINVDDTGDEFLRVAEEAAARGGAPIPA